MRAVLLASSRVPGVGSALSESVLGAFATVLEHLDKTSSSSGGGELLLLLLLLLLLV